MKTRLLIVAKIMLFITIPIWGTVYIIIDTIKDAWWMMSNWVDNTYSKRQRARNNRLIDKMLNS